jgi:hypothetical protein
MLRSLFSEVLPKEAWVSFADHLIAHNNKPEFSQFFCAAYLMYQRPALKKIKSSEQL